MFNSLSPNIKLGLKFTAVFIVFLLILRLFLPQVNKLILSKLLLSNIAGGQNTDFKQDNQKVNILVMGIGGGKHDGADLTDSIIVASLNLKNKTVSLITLPRDIWVEELKGKLNTAYHKGNERNSKTGLILARATVSQIIGIPIHNGIIIDFHAFEKVVNLVNGVDINIDKPFDDFEYPIEGKENDLCNKKEEEIPKEITDKNVREIFPCRFEHIHFDKGLVHMDGATALKYTRSRHAGGEEGTDFARSNRQVKLITAIKNKITKPQVFLNPQYFLQISNDLKGDIDTDLSLEQMLTLGRDYSKIDLFSVKTMTIEWDSDKKSGLLINPPVEDYGAWVLIPKAGKGNWKEIQKQVKLFLG